MKHSANFEKVKTYYDRGMWPSKRVLTAIGKWITEAEAKEILREEQQAVSLN